jgi:hypothetical protein
LEGNFGCASRYSLAALMRGPYKRPSRVVRVASRSYLASSSSVSHAMMPCVICSKRVLACVLAFAFEAAPSSATAATFAAVRARARARVPGGVRGAAIATALMAPAASASAVVRPRFQGGASDSMSAAAVRAAGAADGRGRVESCGQVRLARYHEATLSED